MEGGREGGKDGRRGRESVLEASRGDGEEAGEKKQGVI